MTVRDATACVGGEEARAKVLEFLKKVENGMETEGEIKVTLFQCAKGGELDVQEEIYDFSMPLEEFVRDLVSAAESDAMDIGKGRIKYSVRVAGKNARTTFALVVPEREDEDIQDLDELPNKRGLIGQQMAHNEVFAKLIVDQARESREDLREENRSLRADNAALRRREIEVMKQFEELTSMKFARDLEVMKLHKKEQRMDQVGGLLMQGLPVLFGYVTGNLKLGPGASQEKTETQKKAESAVAAKTPHTELELMLEAWLRTLNQEQLMKIASSGIITPEQFEGFKQILIYVIARDEAEKAAAAQQNGAANGAANSQEGAAAE